MSATLDNFSVNLPDQQQYSGRSFPEVLTAPSSNLTIAEIGDWVRSVRNDLLALLNECGAILFRGFPLEKAEDFDAFIASFDLPNFSYKDSLSNAVRVNKTERVFTANEAPSDVKIYLHHEMAQTPNFPGHLFFFCEQPAGTGGETPICRSDILWQRIEEELPEFAANCRAKGLLYSNVMPDADDLESGMGRSWQGTWRAENREDAQRNMSELGYSWEWREDGSLRATTPVLPAVMDIAHNRTTFFNQLIAAFQGWKDDRNDPNRAIRFGDETPLDAAAVNRAAEIAEELTFNIPWQQGDVALIDNLMVMHGRRTFTGSRKVLASLVAYQGK